MTGTAAYDDLPDGVVVADGQGLVVSINPAAARLLDRTDVTSLLGRPLADVLPLVDPQGRDWWQCTNPFGGMSSRVRQPERLLSLAVDGAAGRDLLVTAKYVRAPDRQLQRLVVCLRDTTARTRTERSGAELVSVVAHELRSPLTSVKGFTATLLTKWERFTDEQKKLMLATVNADADRLTRLISELLDVSRIETGRLELRKQVVDVERLLRDDVAARVAAGQPESRFVIEARPVATEIWADPDKLRQVIGNVVENALRHGAGRVTLTVAGHDGGVRVEVADEGDGIAPETMPRVFSKFWRGNARGGTGLGLFIAKGIVEAHGGTISVVSPTADGQDTGGSPMGARIAVTLPAGTPAFAL